MSVSASVVPPRLVERLAGAPLPPPAALGQFVLDWVRTAAGASGASFIFCDVALAGRVLTHAHRASALSSPTFLLICVLMTYAGSRRWLGISGVGSTVLLCAGALAFDLPHRLIHPYADQSFGTALVVIALTWMLHAALLLPLDFIGGVIGVPEPPGLLRWLASWLRGITVQWCWFALAAALIMRTAQQFGLTRALLVFLLLQVVMLSRQGLIAWLVGGLRMRAVSSKLAQAAVAVGLTAQRVREIECDDRAFGGGWSGANGARLWVPAQWVSELTLEQLTAALARRVTERTSGFRRRSVLVALAWNCAGFALAVSAPRADLITAAGFAATMAWFTLWSFLGILVLRRVSEATRMMLFLSWAGLGGLARAVHCNIGRPSLWVMLPCD